MAKKTTKKKPVARAARRDKKPARPKRDQRLFVHISFPKGGKKTLQREADDGGRTLSNWCAFLINKGRKAHGLRAVQ